MVVADGRAIEFKAFKGGSLSFARGADGEETHSSGAFAWVPIRLKCVVLYLVET